MTSITYILQHSFLLICFLLINLDNPIGQTKMSDKEFAGFLQGKNLTRLDPPNSSLKIGDVITDIDEETIRLGNINDFSAAEPTKTIILRPELIGNRIITTLSNSKFELKDEAIKIEMIFSGVTRIKLSSSDAKDYLRSQKFKPDFYSIVKERETYLITETLTADRIEYRFLNINDYNQALEVKKKVANELALNFSTNELTSEILPNGDVVIFLNGINGRYTVGFKSIQLTTETTSFPFSQQKRISVGRESEYLEETSIRRCKCKDCQNKCSCCPIQ